MTDRDDLLRMDDETLSGCCKLEFFKGSGNGGQKRNKTSSAARVTLEEYHVSAEDCTERSQHRNRAKALWKLRLALAFAFRLSPALPPEHWERSTEHPEYPLWLAHLLDVLAECSWNHKTAAEKCGCTPSALVKKLFRDPEVWQFVNQKRAEAGMPVLRCN